MCFDQQRDIPSQLAVFSLFRRGVAGVFHQVSLKHLERYLREFSYRFNRRDEQGQLFGETIKRMLDCGTLNIGS